MSYLRNIANINSNLYNASHGPNKAFNITQTSSTTAEIRPGRCRYPNQANKTGWTIALSHYTEITILFNGASLQRVCIYGTNR
jgi:hypothetical protein